MCTEVSGIGTSLSLCKYEHLDPTHNWYLMVYLVDKRLLCEYPDQTLEYADACGGMGWRSSWVRPRLIWFGLTQKSDGNTTSLPLAHP